MVGLSPREIEVVRGTLKAAFGQEAAVWLFGSRARGQDHGDIDLYVETPVHHCLADSVTAQRQLEAALHQKVDLVVRAVGERHEAIDAIAKDSGLRL